MFCFSRLMFYFAVSNQLKNIVYSVLYSNYNILFRNCKGNNIQQRICYITCFGKISLM